MRDLPTTTIHEQELNSDREYVSRFGEEGVAALRAAVDPLIDRVLPDVPGSADDAVRETLRRRFKQDLLNSQWASPAGPELRWVVEARGGSAATKPVTKPSIDLVRQHVVGMTDCSFTVDDDRIVKRLGASIRVTATCHPLGYAVPAPAKKKGAARGRTKPARTRSFNVQWSARFRFAIGPYGMTTHVVLRDLLYAVQAR